MEKRWGSAPKSYQRWMILRTIDRTSMGVDNMAEERENVI